MIGKISALIFIIFCNSVVAVERYSVTDRTGLAFITNLAGKTVNAYKDQGLNEGDTVNVDEDSFLTLSGSIGEKYYLSGGSQVSFYDEKIILKNGNLWIQSERNDHQFAVHTANSIIQFSRVDGIITYLSMNEKTQFMVFSGVGHFSNLKSTQNVRLNAGEFSFLQNNHFQGNPRNPTLMSQQTYELVKKTFAHVKFMNLETEEMLLSKQKEEVKNNDINVKSADKLNNSSFTSTELAQSESKVLFLPMETKKIERSIASVVVEHKRKNINKVKKFQPLKNIPIKRWGFEGHSFANEVKSVEARTPIDNQGLQLFLLKDDAWPNRLPAAEPSPSVHKEDINKFMNELQEISAEFNEAF